MLTVSSTILQVNHLQQLSGNNIESKNECFTPILSGF